MSDELLKQFPGWLHMFVVLVILSLGVVVPRRRDSCRHYQFNKRCFRFSLRSVLVATTIVAVLLGLVAYAAGN
jgi:hypothetical protein